MFCNIVNIQWSVSNLKICPLFLCFSCVWFYVPCMCGVLWFNCVSEESRDKVFTSYLLLIHSILLHHMWIFCLILICFGLYIYYCNIMYIILVHITCMSHVIVVFIIFSLSSVLFAPNCLSTILPYGLQNVCDFF